ncbi:hypothetical protein DFQ29_008879 [Apophysomyces sp. BC1021]|nr:hypothetical protein DFQ29_008879 [Apophysomyces sp. BC1021]
MFPDKDLGQISAIEVVWGKGKVRLCLWHMLCAVETKFSSEKIREPHGALRAAEVFSFVDTNFRFDVMDRSGIICRKDRDVLKKLMRKHYLLHLLIPSERIARSGEEIHQFAAKQIYEYCQQHQLPDAWIY